MWTVIRFVLGDEAGYPTAFELLRGAGFREHRGSDSPGVREVFPAAAVADVFQDPAVVTRAVFEALAAARLRPIAVTGSHPCPVERATAPLARR